MIRADLPLGLVNLLVIQHSSRGPRGLRHGAGELIITLGSLECFVTPGRLTRRLTNVIAPAKADRRDRYRPLG
jgi:hypothetical protein